MRDLYARARANVTLTPGERALLKLLEGLLCAGVVAALPIVAGALGHAGVQWSDVGRTALAAGSVAALLALAKYLKAHGDPALGDSLAALAGDLTSSGSAPVREGSAKVAGTGLSDASAGDGSVPESAPVPVLPAQPERATGEPGTA